METVKVKRSVLKKLADYNDTEIFFRGQEYPQPYLKWMKVARQDYHPELFEETPKEIADLFHAGKIKSVYLLSRSNWHWKKTRTYSGMSNWGFGIYLSPDLNFARRYGDFIISAKIPKELIVKIDSLDFARHVSGTPGGALADLVEGEAGRNYAAQAKVFYKNVKKLFGRDKKALMVDDTQICVYDPSIIQTLTYTEIEN